MTYFQKHDDGLDPSRGCLNGMVLGSGAWAAIIYTAVKVFS